MRTMLKVSVDTALGSAAVKDGRIGQVISHFVEKHKPEAAYFSVEDGLRTAWFVFDMKDPSEIPSIAEPFFIETGAKVDFSPVMSLTDLQAGLQRLSPAKR